MSDFEYIKERKCPVCGKNFVVPPNTVYKIKIRSITKTYCSYTCFRKVQKQQELSKPKRKGNRK